MSSSTHAHIEALKAYTSCDLSDALLKLGYRDGGFLAGPTLFSPERQSGKTKIIGPAYTVEYARLEDPRPKVSQHYIDGIPSGAVVFISCPPDIPNAVYGGLMSTRAQASDAVGTIVDGRIRDLQEHRDLGFPVFARETGTTAPAESVKVVSVNTPVKIQNHFQDMTISPGDILMADLDGVVVCPAELLGQAIPLIRPQVEADQKMAEAIKNGMTFTEASKMFRTST